MNGVSVALPVHIAGPHFERALASIQDQTHADLDIMVVLNGSDAQTRRRARETGAGDGRIRIIELQHANLAEALNEALRRAHHEFVARMDADDISSVDRIARQSAHMREHPALIGLGTAFARLGTGGEVMEEVRPPTDPRELRWRLLLGNQFCHGSMMLRRSAVLASGAYNPRCRRAQDYELWARLSRTHDLANLPDILYMHRQRDEHATAGQDPDQAKVSTRVLLHYWRNLPSVRTGDAIRSLEPALCSFAEGGPEAGASIREVEGFMREHGPSREALTAWLWARVEHTERLLASTRSARAREVASQIRASGVSSIYLWGAGAHTAWLMAQLEGSEVTPVGIVDDHLAGDVAHGMRILRPDDLRPGDHALISTDLHEDAVWRASARIRERGVRVWRLYAQDHEATGDGTIALAS